jgi:hypothetical protein
LEHDRSGGLKAADQLNRDFNIRCLRNLRKIGRQYAVWERKPPRSVGIHISHFGKLDPLAGPPGDTVSTFQKDPANPRSDGSEPDQTDFHRFHRLTD